MYKLSARYRSELFAAASPGVQHDRVAEKTRTPVEFVAQSVTETQKDTAEAKVQQRICKVHKQLLPQSIKR